MECDQCGQVFTLATNLTRHIASVHSNTLNYKCELCGRTFTRKDNLTSHQRQKHNSTQPTTTQELSSTSIKQPAQNTNDDGPSTSKKPTPAPTAQEPSTTTSSPTVSISAVPSTPAATKRPANQTTKDGPSTAKKPASQEPSTTTSQTSISTATATQTTNDARPSKKSTPAPTPTTNQINSISGNGASQRKQKTKRQILSQLPSDSLKTLYHRHWSAIKTHKKPGKHQSTYTFICEPLSVPQWESELSDLFTSQRSRFKINYSHSFVLRHKETGEVSFFHASNNNHAALDKPFQVNNKADFQSFLSQLQNQDMLEQVQMERPDSKYAVDSIASTSFYVNHLTNFHL
jgi:hypothetical protein